jgi:DNA-3-methyladenine glycosylase
MTPKIDRLPRTFFERPTLRVAKSLLGTRLVRIEKGGERTSGIIVETEAYIGRDDLACHAKAGKTARNQSMWGPPGVAYVYFTYGMHWMLNFVTEVQGYPAAVLLRGIVPDEGFSRISKRRSGRRPTELTDGPAKICQALRIDRSFDGHDLCTSRSKLFIEKIGSAPRSGVTTGPRVGLNNVPEPWKSKPWRFQLALKAEQA